MLDAAFHARQRPGDAAIVERPVLLQPRHGGIDVVGIELAAGEPRAKLCFRQLARGQER
jgi:hypothetical protein